MSIPARARCAVITLLVWSLLGVFAAPAAASPFAYVTRSGGVSVVDTATQAVITNLAIGPTSPTSVAANPNGTRAYVASGGNVVVIDTTTHTVMATIPMSGQNVVGGLAVKPSGDFAYVAVTASGNNDGWVNVIDTATNTITATIAPLNAPYAVAVTPDESKV
jgi:YVTN family beta-propeller protein